MNYPNTHLHTHDVGFNDLLLEQFKRTPWLLISAAVHLVIFVLLILTLGEAPAVADELQARIKMDEAPIEEELIEPEVPEVVEPLPTEVVESMVEPTEDLVDETDDNETFEETKGEEDFVSDQRMDSSANNNAIALGNGAAGGPWGGRGGGKNGGGGRRSPPVDSANRGLEWLAKHQSPDGAWDADGFAQNGDPKMGPLCDGKGNGLYDVGVTGLSLLCFLGAGETHKAGNYRSTVQRGLSWLMAHQDAEGCFGSKSVSNYTYGHAIAALAMAEAYGMTQSPYLKASAQKGLNYVGQCQNPYGAWRYKEADGQNDTSVTGWMVMALKSGKMAGLEVDSQRLSWALDWIESVTDAESGRTGYLRSGEPPVREQGSKDEFPAEESESLTAVGVLTRIFCGQDPRENRMVKLGADLMAKKLPVWDQSRGSVDMYYWYYGSLAMFQVGGDHWKRWNTAMLPAIIDQQRSDGNYAGSWDPRGAWGEAGGRVYSTALMTLSLEVYYRYGRVFGTGR